MRYSPTVAYRYAKALFLGAGPQSDELVRTLSVAAKLVENPTVREVILDPTLSRKKASQIMSKLLPEAPKIIVRFIEILAEKRRLAYLPYILESYRALIAEAKREIEVDVETAIELSSVEYRILRKFIFNKTGMEPSFKIRTNPRLIAGMILRFGDRVVDMSISGRLKRIKQGIGS
ncbi:MAG: ATP synthase F1 subunit delta [Thermotogae bacterium]|nr:ATP synthase F1 subunit delta [Kosmotoga sp.]MBO8166757.1 ATP synthase F1 subunit delta [Kosmotoga sp.]RKX48283.1 MAG: ATP synthase F1 subunit delta [Thermotogota bacterium]